MFEKATRLLNNNRPEKAIQLFKKLPVCKEVLLNLGTAHRLLGLDEQAKNYYLRSLDPKIPLSNNTYVDTYPIALNNLGLLASTYYDEDTAQKLYLKAIESDPDYNDAYWNLGNSYLRQWCSGMKTPINPWDLYEYRFHRTNPVVLKSKTQLLRWKGQHAHRICVMAEQGFGDQIMFGRYLSVLSKEVDIVVQCEPRASALFSDYETCYDVPPDIKYGIPIGSLASMFDMQPGEWLSSKLRRKVPNGTLDIGITYSGSSSHVNNNFRSCPPGYFKKFAAYGNLYTLNPAEASNKSFTALPSSSWSDTISALSQLDLVISVDTSIVHLCGSLGMPCLVLMPTRNCDFRWGLPDLGFTNIWYPSVKVFRNDKSWDYVTQNVCSFLNELTRT